MSERWFSDTGDGPIAGPDPERPLAEHGDRRAFLDRIRSRQGPPPGTGPHPPPVLDGPPPMLRYRRLDDVPVGRTDALVDVFCEQARDADAIVHVVPSGDTAGLADLVVGIATERSIDRVVRSREPEVEDAAAALTAAGVAVEPYSSVAAAAAGMAVTSATHGIAVTGSVVVDSATAGSRAVSLLSPVHVCVLPADRLVPTHAEVLRSQQLPVPSCRVLITGPSRTGDIEQLLVNGAHGPIELHVIVRT